MQIKVPPKMLEKYKSDEYVASCTRYKDGDKAVAIDVTELKKATLDALEKELTGSKEQTQKLAASVIRLWRDTLKNPNDQKPKTLQHLVECLRGYINQAPHLTLFTLDEHDEQWLPYVVKHVIYHPKSDRSSAHTSISMAYYQDGRHHDHIVSFEQPDLYHSTVGEMLNQKGYFMETPELIAGQEAAVAMYRDLITRTGARADGFKYGTEGWRHVFLEMDGAPAKLVIDDCDEDEVGDAKPQSSQSPFTESQFWGRSNFGTGADPAKMKRKRKYKEDDENYEEPEETDEDEQEEVRDDSKSNKADTKGLSKYFTSNPNIAAQAILRLPLHPYIGCFDLTRHDYVNVHVRNLRLYEFDKRIDEKLVLPKESKELVTVLIENAQGQFEDIIKGKAGGSIVLCAGKPGTGKTLTAEVYAEYMGRPLYTVQCSQLGIEVDDLEKELRKTMRRAMRWGAILLIDEADVYIHERGSDVNQNAIVGVFLRVLEYYNGVLFMTTNRDGDIDDAISSRATAKLVYKNPTPEDQLKLWFILSKGCKVPLPAATINAIVEKHPDLTGRDIKNLLKLSVMLASSRKEKEITLELVSYVRQFKQS